MTTVLNEEEEKKFALLKEWILEQEHLPQTLMEIVAIKFLHSCYYDLEKTKKTITLFFDLRTAAPEVFYNRDPSAPEVQKTLNYTNIGFLRISKNRNLWLWQINDPGLQNYNHLQEARLFNLCADSWLINDTNFQEEDIALMDAKDIELKILTKISLSLARKISRYQEEAIPIRLTKVHIVNAPPIFDKIFAVMKRFFQESVKKIQIHKANSDTLLTFFSKDDLPQDYGGNLPKMEDLTKDAIIRLNRDREYLIDDNYWKVRDKKNMKQKDSIPDTSLRSLDID